MTVGIPHLFREQGTEKTKGWLAEWIRGKTEAGEELRAMTSGNREFNMHHGAHNWQKAVYEYCQYPCCRLTVQKLWPRPEQHHSSHQRLGKSGPSNLSSSYHSCERDRGGGGTLRANPQGEWISSHPRYEGSVALPQLNALCSTSVSVGVQGWARGLQDAESNT